MVKIRLYNFSDPSDLWKEINIYKELVPVSNIKYYKFYKKVNVQKRKFLQSKKVETFVNVFIKNDGEILSVERKSSNGKDYFILVDKNNRKSMVFIDKEDLISPEVTECSVYDYSVRIELIGYSEYNKDEAVNFTFLFDYEVKTFLEWIRDSVIKIKERELNLFESSSTKVSTLSDSEIDEICKEIFK